MLLLHTTLRFQLLSEDSENFVIYCECLITRNLIVNNFHGHALEIVVINCCEYFSITKIVL